MAYDDIGGTGDSFVENWEKNNPGSPIDWRDGANEEQLKQELSSYLNGVMKSSVDQSVGNYNARQKSKGNNSTGLTAGQIQANQSKKDERERLLNNTAMEPIIGYAGSGKNWSAIPIMDNGVLKYKLKANETVGGLDKGMYLANDDADDILFAPDSPSLHGYLNIKP
jgi:hypothetical protein